MSFATLFYACAAAFLLGMGLGMLTEYKLNEAGKVVQAARDLKAAQTGETKIIHDTQVIYKVLHDTTDKCANAPVPANINNLLR